MKHGAVYAAYNVLSPFVFLQEFDWWSSSFKHFDEPVLKNPVFIEVFEETKPLIKLR